MMSMLHVVVLTVFAALIDHPSIIMSLEYLASAENRQTLQTSTSAMLSALNEGASLHEICNFK